MPSSFKVQNNGKFPVIITASPILPAPVKVLPGETSAPITVGANYSIESEIENKPHPPPEVLVIFSPGKEFVARAINNPSVDVDLIAKFDYPKA